MDSARIRSYRLHAHHLDRKVSIDQLLQAARACGLQNTPPGSWETSLFNRIEGCTPAHLREQLHERKTLIQAWSFRGAPVVFPACERDAFLTALVAEPDEEPWIYTRGASGALDYMDMSFGDLLPLVEKAAKLLDDRTIEGKDSLDRAIADAVEADLPRSALGPWRDPSMYGNPDKQTIGQAAVSFLLRPCSFKSLVVFGRREGSTPSFSSYRAWTGRRDAPAPSPAAGKQLARKFLHCYGPTTLGSFAAWLGSSKAQAKRLWSSIEDELCAVSVDGKKRFAHVLDIDNLLQAEQPAARLLLLGAHDPYLDLRDREIILPDPQRRRLAWKTVGNPGVVLDEGRIIGVWNARTAKSSLDVSIRLWEPLEPARQGQLERLAEEHAAFRQLALKTCTVESE
nr:winged helix DNA-binding domain-containing protein [Paraeggerthella hongkongensis]